MARSLQMTLDHNALAVLKKLKRWRPSVSFVRRVGINHGPQISLRDAFVSRSKHKHYIQELPHFRTLAMLLCSRILASASFHERVRDPKHRAHWHGNKCTETGAKKSRLVLEALVQLRAGHHQND